MTPKFLRKKTDKVSDITGVPYIYAYTPVLAMRADMLPCDVHGNFVVFDVEGDESTGKASFSVSAAAENVSRAMGISLEEAETMIRGQNAAPKPEGLGPRPQDPEDPNRTVEPRIPARIMDMTRHELFNYAKEEFAQYDFYTQPSNRTTKKDLAEYVWALEKERTKHIDRESADAAAAIAVPPDQGGVVGSVGRPAPQGGGLEDFIKE